MWDVAYYLAVVILLAAAVIASAFAVRAYMTGAGPMDAVSKLFGPKPERRLDIVEQSNLDGRRRLILIRRDDVEHLIMTGGPVDMVIETGIGERREQNVDTIETPSAVFTRMPRAKGQAGGEQ